MSNRLTLKIFSFILLNELLDSGAQVMMKKGLLTANRGFSGLGDVLGFVFHNAASAWLWAGMLVYAFNFFIWMVILSQLELSLAVPLTSLNYLILPLLALIFLGEKISGLRWLGVLLIIGGVYFLSKSASRKPQTQGVP